MRINTQTIQKLQKMFSSTLVVSDKAKSVTKLGLTGQQWIASFVICLMLMPIFSIPVGATVVVSAPDPNLAQFERVNAELPIWEKLRINLSAKLEEWTTPMRDVNVIHDNDDKNDKKNAKKEKEKKIETSKEKSAKDKPYAKPNESRDTKTNAETTKTITNSEVVGAVIEENAKAPKTSAKSSSAVPALFLNQLPDVERDSVYSYQNNLGNPPGQTEMDSLNQAAALRILHRAGIANFSFGIPLAGLSGRGIDAGVGMTYNSRTWNKSCSQYDTNGNCSQQHFTYDVEQSWIAPGFSSGFGYLQSNFVTRNVVMMNGSNTVNRTLTEIIPEGITDPDGTRRQISCKYWLQIPGGHSSSQYCTAFETADGSLIRVTRNGSLYSIGGTVNYANTNFTITDPNGSKVYYSQPFGSGNSRKHYPLIIQDSNGNRIQIAYKTDQSGRIDYISDTLLRQIKFYYENGTSGSPEKLVAVTIPGTATSEEIQTVRFYYEDMILQTGGFVAGSEVTAPATIRVLKYVYIPSTNTGYKYEYHPKYGMIKKITRQVGMSASTTATNITGTLTEGVFAASTEYDYPDGSTPQSDVPKYTKRTDDWQGRTSTDPQETLYDVPEPTPEHISRITVKDNGFDVVTETISEGYGLLKETSVSKIFGPTGQYNQLMSKTKYTWSGNRNLTKLETTNDAGLTKVTKFEYDSYNNQKKFEEYDYAAPETLGTLLRTTEIEYETGASWISTNLLSLVKSVKTIVDGVTTSKTLYEYDHNGNDSTITKRGDIEIATHDTFYNPDRPAWSEVICPDGNPEGQTALPGQCVTIYHYGYTAASAFRGNVTKATSFSDAALTTDPNADVNNYEYDIAGNLVSATLSCCSLRTYSYDKANEYAFPISQTSGTSPTQLTTSATYNRNTGLVLTSTDENSQVTSYEYETDTLRPKKTIYPNGGYVLNEYSDKLITNNNDLLPGFVRTTTTLETNKFAQNYSYFNGRGLGIRNATQTPDGWSISAVEFDKFGRPIKSYNPFYASSPTGAIPTGTKFTEVLNYDALGRTTSVRLQDLTTVSTAFSDVSTTPSGFNKTFVTVTDQAGKKRRQVADSLGRVVRVDEPDLNGNLGEVATPNQPTSYEYDANDNLKKVTQSDGTTTQERLFKYDSLSRLTHEKQVEANATLNDSGVKVTSGGVWTKVLKYNADGLLTDGYDARGVNTHFTYDGLNRASSVVFTGETGYQTPTINYTYDEERAGFYNKGQLTKVTTAAVGGTQGTPATEQLYDFDKMGRVVKHHQKIDTQQYVLEYGYNLAGQLVSEKYPSGKIVNVGYDANGRLSSVGDASRSYLNGISFNSQTLPSQMNFGNGTNQTFGFNDRLQMTNQTLSRSSEVLQKYDYGYGQIDESGNLDTSKNNGQLARIESFIGATQQWTQKFSYDSVGRLSEAKEYKGDPNTTNVLSYKQKFDFDRFGNLYRKNASNPTAGQENPLPYTPIENADIDKTTNRFTSASGTTYNEAGQVVADNKFRLMSFGYDANGRMVKATKANVPDALSVYDALGNRVATKVNDLWQFVIYDAFGKLVAEYGGLNSTDEGGVKYVLSDWQGSVRASVSNSGYVKSRTDYQAFGEEIQAGVGLRTTAQGFSGGINTRQGYGLTEKDDSTGLNHTWFRKNENRAGRWTSPDPYNGSMSLGNPQSFNRYSYVYNEPTNFVDPSGLMFASVSQYCVQIPRSNGEGDFWYETYCIDILVGGGHWEPDLWGGFVGGSSSVSSNSGVNDDWKKCVAEVDKQFGSGPNVSSEEKQEYQTEISRFWRDDKIVRKGFSDQNYSTKYWTALGAVAGLLFGCTVGKLGGCAAGVAVGGGVGYGASSDSSGISIEQYNQESANKLSDIKTDHPNAVKRENWLSRRQASRSKCDKLLKNRFSSLNNSPTSF